VFVFNLPEIVFGFSPAAADAAVERIRRRLAAGASARAVCFCLDVGVGKTAHLFGCFFFASLFPYLLRNGWS
jgi:hypothetical protein